MSNRVDNSEFNQEENGRNKRRRTSGPEGQQEDMIDFNDTRLQLDSQLAYSVRILILFADCISTRWTDVELCSMCGLEIVTFDAFRDARISIWSNDFADELSKSQLVIFR